MNQNKSALSGRTRTILIAAACVLACAVIVLAIVLIVPHGSSAERKEYESIAAYNEAHGTDYLYPIPPEQTAELYTNMHTYLYRTGWSDRLLHVQFTYVENDCDLYIPLEAKDDLLQDENFAFLGEFVDLNHELNFVSADKLKTITINYRSQSNIYYAGFTENGTDYYLKIDSNVADSEGYFRTILYTIIGSAIEN